jgi:periplasmic divalent cation tolerance protein
MKKFILVLTTVPEKRVGDQIARALVEERLAACVTISGLAKSFYRWEGKISQDQEHVLFIKTRAALFQKVEARVKELHPYKVPELIALPVEKGSADYLGWLDEETSG